ncbi:cardiolipin synthase [Paenibacillus thermoaerophilus]|uniref:Cardiolipin synthase n=1 Tax=Paenibacillus thermoaerophilus TaxID=1215385 RepID=A0ABW2V5S2_9BACL|nr:cardiolipin synthase [Paenibacillus thermoaerophilus]TMV11042.1 cardiolipin synthase [Paenibacillus thermoaerophilus]
MYWLLLGTVLYLLQLATVLALEFRRPARAVAWLVISFVTPLIGFGIYYLLAADFSRRRKLRRLGRRRMPQARRTRRSKGGDRTFRQIPESTADALGHTCAFDRLERIMLSLPGSPASTRNRVRVLPDAEQAYEAMLRAIESARHHIHFCFYILRDDESGRRFRDALIRKASEGVRVRVLYDGIGSYELSDSFIRSLTQAGIRTAAFLPPRIALLDKRLNYRNHRKIVVVDGRIGFTGGLNIGDEYLGMDPKLGHWRDLHLELEGQAVHDLQQIFLRDWAYAAGEKLSDAAYYPPADIAGGQRVRIVPDGPDLDGNPLLELFFTALATARSRIGIVTPYFIPDPALLTAIKTAALGGLDVRIVLPGRADSRLVQWASLSYVQELLDAGVRFFQYQNGFIHSKLVLVDGAFASVGTANLDMRSLHYNFELTAVLLDEGLAEELYRQFERDIEHSVEIQAGVFAWRSRLQRGKEMLGRLLAPML